MSKNNAKSLTTLRQKYRKYAKIHEDDIAVFRENPEAADSDLEVEQEESDAESDDEIPTTDRETSEPRQENSNL